MFGFLLDPNRSIPCFNCCHSDSTANMVTLISIFLFSGVLLFLALLGLTGCFLTCYDRRVRNELAQPCRELCLCCCHPGYLDLPFSRLPFSRSSAMSRTGMLLSSVSEVTYEFYPFSTPVSSPYYLHVNSFTLSLCNAFLLCKLILLLHFHISTIWSC